MARGWESKAVEAQQQDASAGGAAGRLAPMTSAERSVMQRRRTLELARARTAADLQRSSSSAHRSMLEQALRALDEQIEAIDPRR
jgi:hypothetical protein